MLKIAGVALITAAFGVLGEMVVRRNRRERAQRARLAGHGTEVPATVQALDRVSAGKYGSYKVRATLQYVVDGTTHTHVAAWWPQEATHLTLGGMITLLVDPAEPSAACIAGSAAPDIERDSLWRWLTAGVAVVAVIVAVIS